MIVENFAFFYIRDQKMTENACLALIFETSTRHTHFLIGSIGFIVPQKHGYRHQNRDLSYDRAHIMAKYVILYKNYLAGGHFEVVS